MRAVVVSGAGRYADPWHAFAATSAELAAIAREAGLDAAVDEDVLGRLSDPGDADLLVVNIGLPRPSDDAAEASARLGLLAHLAAGRPLLAAHTAITSLLGVPEWRGILGGTWVRGTTMHPPQAPAVIEVPDPDEPLTAGLADFTIDDERYTFVDVDPAVRPLLRHRHEGEPHPLAWMRRAGSAHVGVDLLGHDAGSYRTAEHRTVVRRMMVRLAATAPPR